jgi:indolepyruvate ferredoxin oxidoreductase
MALAAVTLDDKYGLETGRVFLTGTQALVRLPMMQRLKDAAAGRNTAGFVSGYRGSPLGGYDQALWRARKFLDAHHVRFQPGLNEELAATAIWGSQQVNLFPGAKYDGVFSIWYGKGPGVDRAMDAFKHANMAGSSAAGGVLVIAGDDHNASSSTVAHASDLNFIAAGIPILNPAGVQDYVDFGILGWALSRYSGLWVGFTAVAETVESSASVSVDPYRLAIALPEDFALPAGGLNIRWPDPPLQQEARLHGFKLPAALAFARANAIDRVVIDCPKPRLLIATAGKAYLDVRQALDNLGIDQPRAARLGLRVLKIGLSWPLETQGFLAAARGCEEVLVIEEKRPVLEDQIKAALYDRPAAERPSVIGKFDERGRRVLCTAGVLTPGDVARLIVARLSRFADDPHLADRIAYLDAKEHSLAARPAPVARIPYFCSGCPHNTSTTVPAGSRALAGIGCHYMAIWMDRRTATFTQMGGEGATWVGQAPFTATPHVFQNLGDGTYAHSGSLAIRQAIAAGVNMTYKILFNDAVAMTGGQAVEGGLTVEALAWQVHAEGVQRIALVSEEPARYDSPAHFPPATTIHHRDQTDAVQRDLRIVPGVSVLIYDQTCAAEKRRRRKRGLYPDPPRRVVINELVCEGCGDCSFQSNCLSVVPVETEFGRKRAIDHSSCNKDFSCLKGFCPSFVTVHGGQLRRRDRDNPAWQQAAERLPVPAVATLDEPFGILITGVGGTGVITLGALIGMAAHLEGKGVTVLDQSGLAQKGGAVTSHVRIAREPDQLHAVRVDTGGARLLLGADIVVAAASESLATIEKGRARLFVNDHATPTAEVTHHPDADLRLPELKQRLIEAAGRERTEFIDASTLAAALFGDSIATNLFLLGFAAQRGALPVGVAAIERAIELNAVSIDQNRRAFGFGRVAAQHPELIGEIVAERLARAAPESDIDRMVERRVEFLTAYQNAAYAERYRRLVTRARAAEAERTPGRTGFALAVARYAFKLMAYKDEYEVARLFTGEAFRAALARQFEGPYRLEYHLAPPLMATRDPRTGQLQKRRFGSWMMPLFRLLARLRFLRGTPLDIFGYLPERRTERQLIVDYEAVIGHLADNLDARNHSVAVEIAAVPEQIRGFGPIKDASIKRARAREEELVSRFGTAPSGAKAA